MRTRMTRADLAAGVPARTSMSKAGADADVNTVFSAIAVALADGDTVRIADFRTFSVKSRPSASGPLPPHGRKHCHRRIEGTSVQGRKGPSRGPQLAPEDSEIDARMAGPVFSALLASRNHTPAQASWHRHDIPIPGNSVSEYRFTHHRIALLGRIPA